MFGLEIFLTDNLNALNVKSKNINPYINVEVHRSGQEIDIHQKSANRISVPVLRKVRRGITHFNLWRTVEF